MDTSTRLGVVLPTGVGLWGGAGPAGLLDLARRAEALGYDSLWAADTLLRPMVEPLTALAAVATMTERVTVGTAALLPALRSPVVTAQAIASLDLLAGGRLTLAVGAGFPQRSEREYAVSGVPWGRRFARLDDTVTLWRRLWTGTGPTSFDGAVLRVDDIPPMTAPARPGGPPIWLGGFSPAALQRAGRLYDGWLPYPPDPGDYATGLAAVRSAAGAAGRDPDALSPALFSTLLVTDTVEAGRAALDAYTRAVYALPLAVVETIQVLVAGPLDHIEAVLARYVAAGAGHIVFRVAALDLAAQREQVERLAALRP